MEVRYHTYRLRVKVFQLAWTFVFGVMIAITIASWVNAVVKDYFWFGPPGANEIGRGIGLDLSLAFSAALLIPVSFMAVMIIMVLSMYTSISIRESGFRVHSLIGASPWLGWDALRKARRIPLPRTSWMIGIKGLGWLYWLNGLFYWLGTGGIHLTQTIEGYEDLVRVLRNKRPDLFR